MARFAVVGGVGDDARPHLALQNVVRPRVRTVQAQDGAVMRIGLRRRQPDPGFERPGLVAEGAVLDPEDILGAIQVESLPESSLHPFHACRGCGRIASAVTAQQDEGVRQKADDVLLGAQALVVDLQGPRGSARTDQNAWTRYRRAVGHNRQDSSRDPAHMLNEFAHRKGSGR